MPLPRLSLLLQETNTSAMRKAMTSLAGNRTSVPQIWIKKEHIGGCDDLKVQHPNDDIPTHMDARVTPYNLRLRVSATLCFIRS